ncbi:MAG: class E sortase [Mycobacteriales bacterium]
MSRGGDAARSVLRGVGETLITVGVIVLLFCVYELTYTGVYTEQQQSRLGADLRHDWAEPAATPQQSLTRVPLGHGMAVIWIPKVGMVGDRATVVVEGVSTDDLKKGPGHYPRTAMPGGLGNTVISGHRTTYGAPFNRVDELKPGDAIVLETRDAWFTYRVTGSRVVAPTAIEVTYAVPEDARAVPTQHLLTLTTCNPKYSARQRLIVRGQLETTLAKSEGVPPALTGSV